MLAAIDQVLALKPRLLLHGHEPLTRLFSSTAMLDGLRGHLVPGCATEVLRAIQGGLERGAIHAANLIPPTLEAQRLRRCTWPIWCCARTSSIACSTRRAAIGRTALQGLDVLTDADYGAALVDYLGVSDAQLAAAAERMVADGKHELAAAAAALGGSRVSPTARGRRQRASWPT